MKMKRQFNTTGVCVSDMHYMVDISNKLDKIMELIEYGKYFTINRPRQYGKTTTMGLLESRLLKEGYMVISISFEGLDDTIYSDYSCFSREFLNMIKDVLIHSKYDKEIIDFLYNCMPLAINMPSLSKILTDLIIRLGNKVILLIDEVDKSCNNQLFLTFLGMLRNKYLLRSAKKDFTFHSVILAGVHDVKTLKLKLRPEDERRYNSPWNIAADFEVDMSFSPKEISTMLVDYIKDKRIDLDIEKISQELYYYTSGYPFLVSKLCEIIDTKIVPQREGLKDNVWNLEDVESAVRILLKSSNANFDDLIKNLENNDELYKFIEKIIIDGEDISFVFTDNIISLAITYGILKDSNGRCAVNNKIYELLLYDHMMIKKLRQQKDVEMSNYNYRGNFIESGYINMEKVVLKFQQFMKEEYSKKNTEFLERDGRLVLLAFIKPIINGLGFDFKEVQISEEKRLDVVITYLNKKYVLELKRWNGEEAHQKGIRQLWDYLERLNLDKGYLVVFDFKEGKDKRTLEDRIIIDGKEIFMVRV